MTKIPKKLFDDFSLLGSLHTIFKIVFAYQKKMGWETLSLNIPGRHDACVTMCKEIESALMQRGFLKRPRVFFGRGLPSQAIEKMKKIVLAHSGTVVDSMDKASHIISWDEEVDGLPAVLDAEFIRTLDLRPDYHGGGSGVALVHWLYHPDSFDEWIPAQDVDESDPPDVIPTPRPNKQWHVCCRFVNDVEIFNEWGNEIDYEVDGVVDDEDDDTRSQGSRSRSRSNSIALMDDNDNGPTMTFTTVVSATPSSQPTTLGGGVLHATASGGSNRKSRSGLRKSKGDASSLLNAEKFAKIPEAVSSTEQMMTSSAKPPSKDARRKEIAILNLGLGVPNKLTRIPPPNVPVERSKGSDRYGSSSSSNSSSLSTNVPISPTPFFSLLHPLFLPLMSLMPLQCWWTSSRKMT